MFASLLTAPVIGSLLKSLLGPFLDAYLTSQKQKLDAAGSHDARLTEIASKAMDLDKREAEVNAQILIAEQGNWFTRLPRPLMGISVSILVFKILVYDLALGQWTHGSTDKLSPQAFWLMTTIVIAYFGTRSAERIANIVTGVFPKK
jgi:hypothetical protein